MQSPQNVDPQGGGWVGHLFTAIGGLIGGFLANHGFAWMRQRRRLSNDQDRLPAVYQTPPEALRTHDEIRDLKAEAREDGETQARIAELERKTIVQFGKYEELNRGQTEIVKQLAVLTSVVTGTRSDFQAVIAALVEKGAKG